LLLAQAAFIGVTPPQFLLRMAEAAPCSQRKRQKPSSPAFAALHMAVHVPFRRA